MQAALLTNDPDLELQAVRSGRMTSVLLSVQAAPYLRDGSLVPLPSMGVQTCDLYLCHRREVQMSEAAFAFIDFAVQQLQGSQDFAPTLTRLRALEHAATRNRRSRGSLPVEGRAG